MLKNVHFVPHIVGSQILIYLFFKIFEKDKKKYNFCYVWSILTSLTGLYLIASKLTAVTIFNL